MNGWEYEFGASGFDALHFIQEHPGEEFEEMKRMSPELWWIVLNSRCPHCGMDGIKVGGTFRVPKQAGDKGWKEVRRSSDQGEQFSYCLKAEEEKELKREARRVREREGGKEDWLWEKRNRMQALGLLKRSSLEPDMVGVLI
ncbi:hypothetical protein EW146_g6618 [Bondarzewia mesenterica]|uniref:TAP-C domain-containing protein n=1 Tax=Bondarzewia mesenterica TaxID=1095465 RepID=A0A4S4LNZ1_9AGAM|nr:hypothetical protein EW146_g6618 [Bondarzewia mesenterica]